MKVICETERLIIRQFDPGDGEFIIQLLNDPSFIRYIADKSVRTLADAIAYLRNGPLASYQEYGFGLNLVRLKEAGTPLGMCGLLKREQLDHPDIGYAFLPQHCGQGYAEEAANAVLQTEMERHALDTVLAVTLPDNLRSNSLLKKLGFRLQGTMALNGASNNLYQYQQYNA